MAHTEGRHSVSNFARCCGFSTLWRSMSQLACHAYATGGRASDREARNRLISVAPCRTTACLRVLCLVQDQKPWQHTEQMRPVLRPEIEGGNDSKADQDDAAPGAKDAAGASLGICCDNRPPSVHAW